MSQCDACGVKFASEMELIDHKFTWEHLAKETARSRGTESTSGPSSSSQNSSTISSACSRPLVPVPASHPQIFGPPPLPPKHPGTESKPAATTLPKKSANGNGSPMLSTSQEHTNTATSTPSALLPEALMKPVFSSSIVEDDYAKYNSLKQNSCERKIVSKMTSLSHPPHDNRPFSHPLHKGRPPPPPPPQPHQHPHPPYHHYPSHPPYHYHPPHPPYNYHPPQYQRTPSPWAPRPPQPRQHTPSPWAPRPPPQRQRSPSPWAPRPPTQHQHTPPPWAPRPPPQYQHHAQHQSLEEELAPHAELIVDNLEQVKSPSKSRRKSSSPRRHNPKSVLDKTNSTSSTEAVQSTSIAFTQVANSNANMSKPTPISNVANGIQSFSTPTSSSSVSRTAPVLPNAPDRVQSPFVASVMVTDSLKSSKDEPSPIPSTVAHRIPASTSASAEFANSTNGRSTASSDPIVPDQAKRDSSVPGVISNRTNSVAENAEQSNSFHQATAAVSTSQSKGRSREGRIIVDEIPKLVPPLAQKPHKRNYPTGEELVIDTVKAMQLPANCDFLPLESQVKEEGHDNSAPIHVKESSSIPGRQTSAILPTPGNPPHSILSENSVEVSASGLTDRINADSDAPATPTFEVPQSSPGANKGSSASLTAVGEVFVSSGNISSELTSQESTESFYTAPVYTPTKSPDPTVTETKACGLAAKHVAMDLEFTTKVSQTTSSFLDTMEKVGCSPINPPVLVSTPPSDEPMECASTCDLEPVAMEVGLDTEDSSSPLLTTPVLQTEPVTSTVAPNVSCIVAKGSPNTNSTVAIVSTLGSLIPARRISTTAAEWMAQVELSLALVLRQPVVTTWASASTSTVLASTCSVPTMSTSVCLAASTEGNGQVVTQSDQQVAGKPGVETVTTGFSRVDTILSNFLESDTANQIAIRTQKSDSELLTDRLPTTLFSYNSSRTVLKRKLFTEVQNVPKRRKSTSELYPSSGRAAKSGENSSCPSTHTSDKVTNPSTGSLHQGGDVADSTIEALQQKVFEEAEKFFNSPLTGASGGEKLATSPIQKHPPDNEVFGAPPELASFVGKLGIYSPTHPDWPESPSQANSQHRIPQEKDNLSSSPESETQVMWNMSDFLCNPQPDQQSTGETSIAVSPNTPLLCTYKTCKQPVYHVSSRLCKEHFEAAKAITAKLGIPEPPTLGTASVPSCSCSGCEEPQFDCSSRLCQQHFEMGCRIKSKLAISMESSSLPCSAVQAQSHANPAQSASQNVPGKQTSSTIGDSGLNIQTSMDFATATETQEGVLASVVSEAPPSVPSIPPSVTRERAPSVRRTPSPSLTPSTTGTASETQVMWNMDDFLCSPQSDQQDSGETCDGPKAPALCTCKSCKEPVYHENSRLCKEHFQAAKAITATLGIPEPPSSEAPVCSCSGCNKPQYDRSSRLCQQHFEMGCRIKSMLAIPPDNPSLPCPVAQTQSNANSTQTKSQVHSKQGLSGIGDNDETNCTTLGIDSEEKNSGTQMQDTAFTVQMSSVPGSHRSAATSGKPAMSVASTRAEGVPSESMVQEGAVDIEPQYGLDDGEPGIDLSLPKRRKLNGKGKKRAGVVQPRAKGTESQKGVSEGVIDETSLSSLPRDSQSSGPGAFQLSSPSLRPDFKVEVTSLNTKEQLLQQEILDIQHQISDVSERVEEKEEELADLKGKKALLQERLQKLITGCQEVLSQKQGLLLQLQGGKTPGAGEGSHGAEPNFTCLNEKEQELQKNLLVVQGELLEMSRRIREWEEELEKLRKEGEQLQTSLPKLQAKYQEVLLQKQTLFCSPSPVGCWPVLQGGVIHPVGTPLTPSTPSTVSSPHPIPRISCKSEPVSPVVTMVAVKSSESERQEVVHSPPRDSLGSKAVLAVETSGTTKDDYRPSPDSSVALIRRNLKTSDPEDGDRRVLQERHQAGPGLSVDAIKFEPHDSSVLSMKVSGNRLYTCSADKTIRAYDTSTGAIVKRYEKHQKTVICLELYTQSPDTTYLLSGSSDKILHMYNAESGKLVTRFKCGVRIMYLCLHNHILFAGLSMGSVLCIDLKKKKCLGKQTCHPDNDGSSISCLTVTDSLLFTAAFDKKVFCWDVREILARGVFNAPFRRVHRLELFGNTVLCMKVCDGLLYCGCGDNALHVYNTKTWEKVKEIRCHKGAVSGIHIMGKVLITASFDKLIRCFDLERLELLQVYAGNSAMVFTLCAANGVIYTGLKDGTVQATALDLTVFYLCKWESCGLRFGNFNHLREHLKEHISSSLADGLALCKWGECSNTMPHSCLLEHLNDHTSELLVESSE